MENYLNSEAKYIRRKKNISEEKGFFDFLFRQFVVVAFLLSTIFLLNCFPVTKNVAERVKSIVNSNDFEFSISCIQRENL